MNSTLQTVVTVTIEDAKSYYKSQVFQFPSQELASEFKAQLRTQARAYYSSPKFQGDDSGRNADSRADLYMLNVSTGIRQVTLLNEVTESMAHDAFYYED